MKSRLGSAIVALSAFAAISIGSTRANAQAAQGQTVMPPPATGTYQTYQPSTQAPTGEFKTEVYRPNVPMMATGALTFLGAYVPSLVVGLSSSRTDDHWLYLPIVGPFVDLGVRGCDTGQTTDCGVTDWERGALIASGAVQAVGVGLIVYSFFSTNRKLTMTSAKADKPRLLEVTPVELPGHTPGLMAVGVF